ncbi:MAG TPA: hypothetical protein VMF89_16325, partial [Polyangiales bacterium]|nr:hypothetical protein [Polyangiales bacterium]
RRRGDFALAGVAASLTCEHGIVSQPRLTVFGAVSRPMRLSETEELINGADAGAEVAAAAGASATKEVKLRGDVHASTDSRQRMLRALVRRAVIEASERAAHE